VAGRRDVGRPGAGRFLYNGGVTGLLKLLSWLALTAVVLIAAAGAYTLYWNGRALPVTEDIRVELEPGQSFAAFADALEHEGLLTHARIWSVLARLSGAARRVQAGEYWVRVGDTPAGLLDRLLAGDVVVYEVKLLEGWTVRQALAQLAVQEPLLHELDGADETTLLGALGLPAGHAEGMFFPDTYRYERGASDADILRRAYNKLQDVLAAVWASRDSGLPYETPYQVLIAASLIEKETGRDEDRAKIAQVFATRLAKGMRLQTDPSVIYGVGGTFDGNLTRRHLVTDTPYNTYTRKGLPPTPIALVGARSLDAAVHPAGGDYLYFVSRGDGTSHFSASLEEHEAAVRKYQLQ
jgi:UPF0755 protein